MFDSLRERKPEGASGIRSDELDQGREDLFKDLRSDEQSHGSGNAAHGAHDGAADDADT